jgi:hypothetical protein
MIIMNLKGLRQVRCDQSRMLAKYILMQFEMKLLQYSIELTASLCQSLASLLPLELIINGSGRRQSQYVEHLFPD